MIIINLIVIINHFINCVTMGKQINFYMNDKVQENLITYLVNNGFMFLNINCVIIDEPYAPNVYGFELYKNNYGELILKPGESSIMDKIRSPIIEIRKTIIKIENKKVSRGRIWMSDYFYDDNGNKIKKNTNLINDYNALTKWIKRNVPYQEIKKGEKIVKEYVNNEIKELQIEGYNLTL